MRSEELTAAAARNANKKEIAKIKKDYKDSLDSTPIIRTEKLPELLREFKRIGRFQVDFDSLAPHTRLATPLEGHVARTRQSFTFIRHAPINILRQGIISTVDSLKITRGTVSGIDQQGLARTIKLANNLDTLEEFEFDDLAGDMAIDLSKFHECAVFATILAAVDSRHGILDAPE